MAIPSQVREAHRDAVKLTKEAIALADEATLVDLAGLIRGTEAQFARQRKLAVSELPAKIEGGEWRIETGRIAKRSYNTTGLLAKFADQLGLPMMATIGHLLNTGVIKIEWQWTKLKEEMQMHEIPLLEVSRTINDGDEADVGSVWVEGYPRYEHIGAVE